MLPKFLRELDPELYLGDNYVVVDFEVDNTVGYGSAIHRDNHLILACWRVGPGHPRYDGRTHSHWGSEFDQAALLQDIAEADFIVAHHAKFELGWLRRSGLDLREVLPFDTLLAEYVLLGNLAAGDETMPPRALDLDTCCRRRGLPVKDPVVDVMIGHGINPVCIPRPWLEGRCRQDVETTEQVFLDQRAALHRTNRLAVLYTRCLLTPVLADIEFEGMALDKERVEKAHAEHFARFVELQRAMDEITGGINWRSTKQVAEFVYDRLKFSELRHAKTGKPIRNKGPTVTVTGKPVEKRKVDKKTLDKLVATTDEQKRFIAVRKELGKVNAALSKNLDFFLGVVRERGGVFHAEFNQANTATNRLSSSGIPTPFELFDGAEKSVQLQNSPRAFKKLYRAKRAGWLMFEPDGSMLEFRVAAYLGQDPQAIRDIEDLKWDAHVQSGSVMVQLPYKEVWDGWMAENKKYVSIRQEAKPETFKPLYGGERGTEAQERWYREFKERYKKLAEVQKEWVNQVVSSEQHELVTPWGLRFYWPFVKVSYSGVVSAKSAIYNYPVQALATAEIIPIALVYFWHRLRERNLQDLCYIVNTVHDSVPCEVHPDALEAVEDLAKQCFTTDVYEYLRRVYKMEFNVPLGVGSKAGEFWGDGPETSIDVYPDGREVCRKGCK